MRRKPKVNTSPPAAYIEGSCSKIIEVSWPSTLVGGLPAGSLMEFSEVQPEGKAPRPVFDIYRHDSAILVRVQPEVVQDPEMPFGVTIAHSRKVDHRRIAQYRERMLDLEQQIERLEQAIVNIATIVDVAPAEPQEFQKVYQTRLYQAIANAVAVMERRQTD